MWDENNIIELESPKDIGALVVNDLIKAEMNDGYKGFLVCAGQSPEKHEGHLQIMVRNAMNVVYFLCGGHISVDNGIARQKADCQRYERGGEPRLFELIDRRLFND